MLPYVTVITYTSHNGSDNDAFKPTSVVVVIKCRHQVDDLNLSL